METEPSYGIAFKLWWAMTWRGLGFAMLGAILLGVIIGVLGAVVGLDKSVTSIFGALTGFGYGFWVILWTLRRLMIKGFGKYRLAVMVK